LYEFLDAAVVRAPAWQPGYLAVPWPDLTGAGATPGGWRTWLKTAWQESAFACAVEAASPDLARQVARILDGKDVAETDVRRAVVSTLRYLLRAQSRATPFGLLAGVAPVRLGATTRTRAGDRDQVTVRADAAWLAEIVSRLEADAALAPRLPVIASNLAIRRGQCIVIEHRASDTSRGTPMRVQIRATAPVLAALDAARYPIRTADLAGQLAVRFPGTPGDIIDGLISDLVGQRFLLTGLRPATTDPDPLAAVLRVLDTFPLCENSEAGKQRIRLHAIRTVLSEHDAAPAPVAAHGKRAQISSLMAAPPAIDLRLDWDLTIPNAVAAEAAQAAGIMALLARRPALSAGWINWHSRFLDRYGPGAVVPMLDAVDAGTGLGYPAGYLGSPYPTPATPLTDRDKLLLKLAGTATIGGDLDVMLDDLMISELSAVSPDTPVQPSAEITARIQAGSTRDLDEGRFTLHVTGASRGAGTITGRFLHILDGDDREHMASLYAATHGVHEGALTAQLSAAALHARTGNVARAPRTSAPAISLGEYHVPDSGQIPLTDLAVTADATRLQLVSISRGGRPVHTIMLNAVDLACHSHPLTRFLAEAPVALAAPCTGLEWGAAHALPFLPAVRYRRAVLSPARWVLATADLPGEPSTHRAWDAAFAAWQSRVSLPDWTYLGDGDQCIRLHLTEPSHRALVRDALCRTGTTMFRTAPAPEDLGWTDGRVHEIVIPVAATRQTATPVRWSGEVTGRRHGCLPARDGRLYLKLHSNRHQQDTILTRHVPDLKNRLASQLKRCWFIRYDHRGEQLRLRLALSEHATSTAIEQVSAWTETLRDAGLINSASWATYYPETARFGGTAAFDAAEEFFAADSAAAIAQLAACAARHGPGVPALAAASLVDIAVSLFGDDDVAMHWLAGHTATDVTPPPRTLYNQAVTMVTLRDIPVNVAVAWEERRAALKAYSSALDKAGIIQPEELLPDLLHLHHARMAGPDLPAERACLHLARAAALSRIARTRKTEPA
jgi:lantibiotic biosynthesis protein